MQIKFWQLQLQQESSNSFTNHNYHRWLRIKSYIRFEFIFSGQLQEFHNMKKLQIMTCIFEALIVNEVMYWVWDQTCSLGTILVRFSSLNLSYTAHLSLYADVSLFSSVSISDCILSLSTSLDWTLNWVWQAHQCTFTPTCKDTTKTVYNSKIRLNQSTTGGVVEVVWFVKSSILF